MFDGPTLVPIDADDETTVIHIIKSLQKLEFIADNIFLTAKTRLISCRDRVCSYNNRIKILEQKVEVLKNVSVYIILINFKCLVILQLIRFFLLIKV